MKKIIYFAWCFWLLVVAGCTSGQVLKNPAFVSIGKVLKAERIKAGGSIVILPFRAGPGVEADEKLDQMALMVMKGIGDVLEERPSTLHILKGEDGEADFWAEGHITAVEGPSQMKRLMPGKKKIRLTLEGKLIDAKTEEAVLIFSDSKAVEFKEKDHKQLAYEIGRDVGEFLLSSLIHGENK